MIKVLITINNNNNDNIIQQEQDKPTSFQLESKDQFSLICQNKVENRHGIWSPLLDYGQPYQLLS